MLWFEVPAGEHCAVLARERERERETGLHPHVTAQNFMCAAAQLSLARRIPFSRLNFFEFMVMLGSMFARGVKWADVEEDDLCQSLRVARMF